MYLLVFLVPSPSDIQCFQIQMVWFEEGDRIHSLLFPNTQAEFGLPTHRQASRYL